MYVVSSMEHVYIAMPLVDETFQDLQLNENGMMPRPPLLHPAKKVVDPNSHHDDEHDELSPNKILRCLLAMEFVVINFLHVNIVYHFSSDVWNTVAWICLTTVAPYAFFSRWRTQHQYSQGVVVAQVLASFYVGISLVLAMTHVLSDSPLQVLLMSQGVATAWAVAGVYFGGFAENEDSTDDIARESTRSMLRI